MSAPLGALLFDLDGTLLDTAPEFTHCLNTLLREEGRDEVQEEQLREHVSFGASGMLRFGFSMPEQHPQFSSLRDRFLQLYRRDIGSKTKLFPGISHIIDELTQRGLKWGIVTNKPQYLTMPLLEVFKPLVQAQCVVAGDTLPNAKPHPAPMLHACQALNVDPAQCWYVGDAETDVVASRNAGMPCAIAQYGYIPKHTDVKLWQADKYFLAPHDIAEILAPSILK